MPAPVPHKRYRLLKDLPVLPAGTMLVWDATRQRYVAGEDTATPGDRSASFLASVVWSSPEWFEAVTDEVSVDETSNLHRQVADLQCDVSTLRDIVQALRTTVNSDSRMLEIVKREVNKLVQAAPKTCACDCSPST